jgi:hypothetical protein
MYQFPTPRPMRIEFRWPDSAKAEQINGHDGALRHTTMVTIVICPSPDGPHFVDARKAEQINGAVGVPLKALLGGPRHITIRRIDICLSTEAYLEKSRANARGASAVRATSETDPDGAPGNLRSRG